MTKPDFPKKFSFRPDGHGRAQNGPKIRFFGLFSKSAHLFFLIFCTKLEEMWVKKWPRRFFPENSYFSIMAAFTARKTPFFAYISGPVCPISLIFGQVVQNNNKSTLKKLIVKNG